LSSFNLFKVADFVVQGQTYLGFRRAISIGY